jgi:hypothetical protein
METVEKSVRLPDGRIVKVRAPKGATDKQILAFAKKQYKTKPKQESKYQKEAIRNLNDDISWHESSAIAMGRGITDIGRAVGLLDEEDDIVKQSFEQLNESNPTSQMVGRAVGQAIPFTAPGAAIGAIPTLLGRVGAAIGLGATEGGLIANATGQDEITGAGAGGAIAGLSELALPYVGRVVGRVYRSVTGKSPKGALFDAVGNPTPEMQKALDESGMTMEDITDLVIKEVKSKGIKDPEQVARFARMQSEGVPMTRGDVTQDFVQQGNEARLLELQDDAGAPIRSLRVAQSDIITNKLNQSVDSLGLPDRLGNSIKDALSGREILLKNKKNALYREAAKRTETIGSMPILGNEIIESLPDARTIRRVSRLDAAPHQALNELLAEYGLDRSEDALAYLSKNKIQVEPLSLANFDDFRMALGQIDSASQTGAIKTLTGPIRRALDIEADNIATILQKQGVSDESILSPLLEARKTVRQLKTEFSPQSITGRLIDVKRDGVTPIIEASKVFDNVVGTNKPIEFLERTVASLSKAGDKGKIAMGDLQAATVAELLESAFKSQGRKVDGSQLINVTAFNNKLAQIGEEKLKLIFQNNPTGYRDLMKFSKILADIRPSDYAVPKGSGSVILDVLKKAGIVKLSSSVPMLGVITEGMTSLAESGARRKQADIALEALPKSKDQMRPLIEVIPSLAVALGLTEDEDA